MPVYAELPMLTSEIKTDIKMNIWTECMDVGGMSHSSLNSAI